MLLNGADAAAISRMVTDARTEPPAASWQALADLLTGRAPELDKLAGELRETGSDHIAMGGVTAIAAFFDRAASHSPEAGVALYSLGDPAILQAATQEIVDWLLRERLLSKTARVLDFGCGMGRVAAVLASHCASVVGLDVSAKMIAEAQRRHADRPELTFAVTDGQTLPPGPFDLVLLVDSMPYVLQAGLADGVVALAAAALSPAGALVALNLSYGRSRSQDVLDAERWAAQAGWSLQASHPFKLWDGAAFVWRPHTEAAPRPI